MALSKPRTPSRAPAKRATYRLQAPEGLCDCSSITGKPLPKSGIVETDDPVAAALLRRHKFTDIE